MANQVIFKTPEGEKQLMELYRKALAAWPVPGEERYVETSHGRTFVLISGDPGAPPLVLIHGSGSNAVTWGVDIPLYSRHFRVYTVDIPGEPGKSERRRVSWEGPGLAEWCAELFKGLGLVRAAVAGLSLGGWIACRFAINYPEMVTKLVLIAAGGIAPARSSFPLKMIWYALQGPRGKEKITGLIMKGQKISPEAQMFIDLTARHFNYRTGSPPLFSDSELAGLDMPVYYLAGEDDCMLNSRRSAKRLSRLLPRGKTELLPGQGHGIIGSASRVLEFLHSGETPDPGTG